MERGISYNMIYNDGTFVIYEINMQLLIDQGIIKVDDAQNQSQTADQTIEDTTEAVTE